MAALDFPASPTNGQVFTSNGSSWTYDSTKVAWRSSPYEPGAAITSATAPTTPQNGDIWFNTNDGTLYTYYNDGTTAQWVEVRSEIATSQVGLVPIVPTSVTVSSGTASSDSSGAVTFNTVGAVMLNGVFSNTYKHYKVKIEAQSSVGATSYMRMCTGGTSNTTTNYLYQQFVWQTNTSGGNYSGADNWFFLGYLAGSRHHKDIEISNAFQTQSMMGTYSAGYGQTINIGVWNFNGTTSFDGLQFFCGSGTVTGTIKVYGYN